MCNTLMASTIVRVSKKYQVVIPETIRRESRIRPGDEMMVLSKHGVLQYVRIRPIENTKGIYTQLDARDVRDEHDRT